MKLQPLRSSIEVVVGGLLNRVRPGRLGAGGRGGTPSISFLSFLCRGHLPISVTGDLWATVDKIQPSAVCAWPAVDHDGPGGIC